MKIPASAGPQGPAGTGGGTSFPAYDGNVDGIAALKHRWKFNDVSGNFADSKGALTLVKTGSPTYGVAGQIDNAVTFAAASKGESSGIGNVPTGGNARTILAIVKPQSRSVKQCIFSYGASGSSRQWFSLFFNDGLADQINLDVWADDLAASLTLTTAAFFFIAALYDGSTGLDLYINGSLYSKTLGGVLNTGSGSDFWVGQDTTGSNQFLGTIDDIAVINRRLTSWELQELYFGMVPTSAIT